MVQLAIRCHARLPVSPGEPLLAGHRLADALRDMRLLGLRPTLLAPGTTRTNGRAP